MLHHHIKVLVILSSLLKLGEDLRLTSYQSSTQAQDEFLDTMLQPSSLPYLEEAPYLQGPSTYNMFSNKSESTFNDSFAYDEDDDMDCSSSRITIGNLITMILYSLVCIVGLFGNTLVIYVVLRFSKMQTVTNIYILNLAIADECFLIGIPFLLYTMQIGSWKFGKFMCKAYMVSTSITQFTSSIFLLIMSADRYIAVCHPISSPQYRTPIVSKIVSGIAWLASAVLMLPVMLFASTVQNGEHISCNIKWPEGHSLQSSSTFILYTFALGFATPLCFILCFYYLVIRKLHTVGPKNKSKEKKRSHRKVTKLVLTVITVYVMCWLPYWISQVTLISSSPSMCASRLEITIFLLVGCLGYSNSAMNPILYAFLSDNFKKSFKKAFTCAARKNINAQFQMESSMFSKIEGGSGGNAGNKHRYATARLQGEKSKPQKLRTKIKKKSDMLTTTTGTSPDSTLGLPTHECQDLGVTHKLKLFTPKQTSETTILLVTTTSHEEGEHPNNVAFVNGTEGEGIKPPVLQTDL